MSRYTFYSIIVVFLCCNFITTSIFAERTRKKDIIVRGGINGLLYYYPKLNLGNVDYINYNKLGFGSTFQIGYNTRKTDLTEYRHYIEFNHISYSADIEHIGSFKANKLFLSLSPYQYYLKLNPEAANVFSLEVGLSIGFNLYSVYNYKLLGEERTSKIRSDETGIVGINVALMNTRTHFNKEAEMGIKWRISPILGVIEADHNYFAAEIFYGIKF